MFAAYWLVLIWVVGLGVCCFTMLVLFILCILACVLFVFACLRLVGCCWCILCCWRAGWRIVLLFDLIGCLNLCLVVRFGLCFLLTSVGIWFVLRLVNSVVIMYAFEFVVL